MSVTNKTDPAVLEKQINLNGFEINLELDGHSYPESGNHCGSTFHGEGD